MSELRKRRFIPLAEQRVGKSGRRTFPAAKAFTLSQRVRPRVVLAWDEKPQHGVPQEMPPRS